MKFLRSAGLAAGLAVCLSAPASAADVSVRVEGAANTVIPRKHVSTTARAVVKDGNPAHACPGSSAAGALERATGGDWSGPWFDGLGYSVERVKGETHSFSSSTYWAFWVDYKPAAAGVCGVELEDGDEVLLFPDCFGAGCVSPTPLRLSAPDEVAPGGSVEVKVTAHPASGSAQPSAGATVSGGERTYTTGADGKVDVTVESGTLRLRATKAGHVRSASERICSTTGRDGRCGAVTIRSPRHGRSYQPGPRRLRGEVSPDPSGLREVRLRLTRRAEGRCETYSARRERFRRVDCGKGVWFSAGQDRKWSYALPRRLEPGSYVLEASAVDNAGDRDRRQTGRNRVVFTVR